MTIHDQCPDLDAAIAAIPGWTSTKDYLEWLRWRCNCPNKVPPASNNWGATFEPPPNPNLPPNPDTGANQT